MSRELALCLLALAYVAFAAARSGAGAPVLLTAAVASFSFWLVYRRSQVAAGSDRVSPSARVPRDPDVAGPQAQLVPHGPARGLRRERNNVHQAKDAKAGCAKDESVHVLSCCC